ncbi:hypothetical protein Ancab_012574 [Ancistrocladus abbreviatus]
MEMQRKLYDAALNGSVSTLKALLKQDPLILEKVSPPFYAESPLHIAALRGHSEFARAILSHNPKLATEFDSLGYSPLHLAAAKGYVAVVRDLLSVECSASLCLARGKEDAKLPLHLAVIRGKVEAVRELAKASPESTRMSLERGESVLHLCVRYNSLEAMKVLAEMVKEEEEKDEDHHQSLLNSEDEDGNSLLHVAALLKQLEVIKYLLSDEIRFEVNALNKNGLTALDLLDSSPKDLKALEVQNFLIKSGARRAKDLTSLPHQSSLLDNSSRNYPTNNALSSSSNRDNSRLEELKGVLMLAAAVAVATTFQAGVNVPPGDSNLTTLWNYNVAALLSSLTIILLLASGWSLKNTACALVLMILGCITLTFMPLAYLESVNIAERRVAWIRNDRLTKYLIVAWLVLLYMVALFHFIRFCIGVKRRN